MARSMSGIGQLVSERRLYAARDSIETLRESNSKVYGLDDLSAQIEQKIEAAEALIAEGDRMRERAEPQRALRRYRKASQAVADHLELSEKTTAAENQVEEARNRLAEAREEHEAKRPANAASLVDQALAKDAQLAEAREFKEELESEYTAGKSLQRIILAGILLTALGVSGIGLFFMLEADSAKKQQQREAVIDNVAALFQKGKQQIERGQYRKAERRFEKAKSKLATLSPEPEKWERRIDRQLHSASIIKGTKGLVPFEGKWVEPERRERVKRQRKQFEKNVDTLRQSVDASIEGNKLDGDLDPDLRDRLFDVERKLIRVQAKIGADDWDEARSLYADVQQQASSLFRQAGLVQYKDQWMTPEVAKAERKRDKGLVQYDGRWMEPEEAKAQRKRDQGLVQYNGKWMTPAEVKAARKREQGLVQYKGEWMTPKEKEVAQKRDQGMVRVGDEWLSQEELARRQAQLKRDAYSMSQEFLKDKLKAPASARFPAYDSPEVVVVKNEEGHYLVRGVVDAENGFGAMLRSEYVAELWPTDAAGQTWKSDGVYLNE
jgi:hypothetical protein